MQKMLLTVTAALTLFFSGCASSEQQPAPEKSAVSMKPAGEELTPAIVEKEIELAEAKYAEVKKMRSIVWRQTRKFIDKAKEHASKNELEDAHKAAREALFELKTAVTEHEEALKVWRSAMPQALMQ